MKLLLQSAPYAPQVGGIETVARLLAEEFTALGHDVTVLTETAGADEAGSRVTVLRQAAPPLRRAALRNADAVLMFGTSLRFLPLPVLSRRPLVVSHHGWYDGRGPAEALKRLANRFTRNVAASKAIAAALHAPATVIPNPYDDALFRPRPEIQRDRDLAFVGRLVSDKGLPLLLEALAVLARDGVRPRLTVIGEGPEEASCRQAAASSDIQVMWAGVLRGEELALTLNRHRVLVAPSLWNEPFGVVALEGLASGCGVVGSSGGGLPEAMGPAGRTFPNGDARALADTLKNALAATSPGDTTAIGAHLRRHSRRAAAEAYLDVLRRAAA